MNSQPLSTTIKQVPGTGMCAVCVAAMATGTSVEDVYAFLNDGREMGDPMHDPELAMYLLRHGFLMGHAWQVHPEEGPHPDDRKVGCGELKLCIDGIAGIPAYLAVRSANYHGLNHAVYWDGEWVRDPDPGVPNATPLSDYVVVSCWPLTRVDGDFCKRMVLTPSPEPPFFVRQYRKKPLSETLYSDLVEQRP